MMHVFFMLVFAVASWEQYVAPPSLPPATISGLASVNGARLWYAEYGQGEPVILLHWGLGNANHWSFQVPALARRYRVIVMDTRGHGRSSRGSNPLSFDLLASDVVGLMDYLHIEKAAVVGWSDGAIVAIDVTMRYPDRVMKLFAFGANSNPAALVDAPPTPALLKWLTQAATDYKELSPTPDGFKALLREGARLDGSEPNFTKDQFGAIRVPTWIVGGDHDSSIKRQDFDFMAQAIPNAGELILPGVGHEAPLQDPELFNAALLRFLELPRPGSNP